MLKTSESTESTTRLGKGRVGFGDDGGDNGDHNCKHSLPGSGQAHQRTHQLARPRLWLSLMGLILMVVLLANWSKSCQKSKNCQKVQKASKDRKICKDHWFGETFTKAPVLRQWRTQAFVTTLTVFQALFAGPRSSFNTIFELSTNKLIFCRNLLQKSQEDLRAEDTRIFYQL